MLEVWRENHDLIPSFPWKLNTKLLAVERDARKSRIHRVALLLQSAECQETDLCIAASTALQGLQRLAIVQMKVKKTTHRAEAASARRGLIAVSTKALEYQLAVPLMRAKLSGA